MAMAYLVIIVTVLTVSTSVASQYQCNTTDMTPNDRKVALEKHNDARRQIAEGYPTRGDMVGIPPAANMNRLNYSCHLEEEAQKAAEKACKRGFFKRNFKGNSYIGKTSDVADIITYWFKDGVKTFPYLYEGNMTYTDRMESAHTFVQLEWASEELVGCGIKHECGEDMDETAFDCKYHPKPRFGEEVYEDGKACTKCKDSEKCENYLCIP